MAKEKYIEKEYWLGTEEEYHAGADYAFYELCKELDVPSADIRKSKDTIDGIAARLAVRINETINERLCELAKENKRLKEENKQLKKDCCDILMTCDKLMVLLGEDYYNDQR